jgi:hypothetical protein
MAGNMMDIVFLVEISTTGIKREPSLERSAGATPFPPGGK